MTLATETTSFRRAHEAVMSRADDCQRAIREAAFAAFQESGLPTTRQEAWRFTSVAALGKIPFHAPPALGASTPAAHEMSLTGHEGIRIVLLNGRLAPEMSRLTSVPDGVVAGGLADALRRELPEAGAHLHALVDPVKAGAFPSLNAALFEDGAIVVVPCGVVLERPIHVIHVADALGEPVLSSPRLLVVLHEGAQATVVETHAGRAGESLTNAVTEIRLEESSVLDHVMVQVQAPAAWHVGTTHADVGRSATLRSHVFSLGARLSRHDLAIRLSGEGASAELYGLSLLGGVQHADHHTSVEHAVPHGTSRQVYEGAYAGASRGVFSGAVRVAPGAQQTVAHQRNRNLILSDEALVDSKPELEIHADDVKCTHGATIGQLDAAQLFYLISRGLSRQEARQMLVHGFLQGQVDRLRNDALRADLSARVAARGAGLERP